MAKKRLLVLTPRFPYPVIGGDRLRIYEVCKVLSRYFRLTLLSLCETQEEMRLHVPADGVFNRVERVWLPQWRSYLNVIKALPGKEPLQIAYYKSREFQVAVDRLLGHHDGALAHLIRVGQYLRGSESPKVLEMTDAISLNYNRVRRKDGKTGFRGLIYRLEADRLLMYEREIVQDFDTAVLVSHIDRNFLFGDKLSDKVLVCSNGVDLHAFPYRWPRNQGRVIAFIGNMSSVQNLDACLYFASEVLPLIRRRTRMIFRVVGRISEKDAKSLRAYEGVEVTGSVRNIADAVADARVGVCPVRIGAGVQNKVLEYMALGLPTITSKIGLEGFDALPGRDLLVANSPEEYAAKVLQLFDNLPLAEGLSRSGRAYVEQNHLWTAQLRPLVERMESMLQG